MKRLIVGALTSALLLLVFPSVSNAADTSAPVLVDWKLIDLKTDISNGNGFLRIQFSVSDESDISEPLSNVGSTTTTQQTGFAFPKLISKVGNVSTYTAEATVKFGQAPGIWRWLLFPLMDVIGNSSQGFGPGGSWPINVWVYDKDFTEAKRLAAEAADAKAAAELKAKQEAEAKAIADKAAAELKAKQEAEAKAIADKAAEANRREQTISVSPFISGPIPLSASGLLIKVSSTSNLSVFAYNSTDNVCEFANGLIKTKTSGRCVIAFSQEGNSEFKPATNFILDFSIVSAAKTTTITCVKGKLTKKVTAVKPKCPSGYKVKK